MPASTTLFSTAVSVVATSGSKVLGEAVIPALASIVFAAAPHGAVGSQATYEASERLSTPVTLPGLLGGTAIISVFVANRVGLSAVSPAVSTIDMLASSAVAMTSTGAPDVTSCASV